MKIFVLFISNINYSTGGQISGNELIFIHIRCFIVFGCRFLWYIGCCPRISIPESIFRDLGDANIGDNNIIMVCYIS